MTEIDNQPTEPTTAAELAEQIEALVTFNYENSDDGYSESADALWKAALLAFNYASSKVGATGFQAGYSALKFYGEAMHVDCPFGVVMAHHALFPQYDEIARVRNWIGVEWRPWIVEQAQAKVAGDVSHVHPNVLAHWHRLATEKTDGVQR